MAASLQVPSVDTKTSQAPDPYVQPFLQPDFDPAAYLNSTLPSLSTRSPHTGRTVPLPELSTQLQTLLSQLNAQVSRLSATLTQLTDEIIRSGGRLAYEVEVLRGETTGLTDSLQRGLKRDIDVFVPPVAPDEDAAGPGIGEDGAPGGGAPLDHLDRLQTLSSVRERLDRVIKTFGDAMAWPLAPSELSMASSIISVSAPGNDGDDGRGREEKGKEYIEGLRAEIDDLLGSGETVAAAERVDYMRRLAEVWKGTAEEKARLRLVEGLQKGLDERQRALQPGRSGAPGRKPTPSPSRGGDLRYGDREGSYGFLSNLKKLGGDVYLE